jgi:hypothetical protein
MNLPSRECQWISQLETSYRDRNSRIKRGKEIQTAVMRLQVAGCECRSTRWPFVRKPSIAIWGARLHWARVGQASPLAAGTKPRLRHDPGEGL